MKKYLVIFIVLFVFYYLFRYCSERFEGFADNSEIMDTPIGMVTASPPMTTQVITSPPMTSPVITTPPPMTPPPMTPPPMTPPPMTPQARAQAERNKQAADRAARDKANRDKQAADRAARDKAARDKQAADKAARDKQAADRAARDKAARDKQAADKAARDKQAADKQAADKAARDKQAADKAARDKAVRDKQAADKAAAAKVAADKAAAAKLAADKAAAAKLAAAKFIDASSNPIDHLPKGLIVAWNKIVAPIGWVLCDGTNGTPDLRGKFILAGGQGRDTNGKLLTNIKLNEKGGNEEVTLTLEQIPKHNHHWIAYNDDYNGKGGGNRGLEDDAPVNDRNKRKIETNFVGGGEPHTIMPPFYVLTYIMKL